MRDMDVIFCRNILIYFDKPTQEAVLAGCAATSRPGGCLFIGHSETVAGLEPAAGATPRPPSSCGGEAPWRARSRS